MVYSVSFDKSRFFQQAAPQSFLNFQEGAKAPASQKPENKPGQGAESQTPEIIPDAFKSDLLSELNQTTGQYEMTREKWGNLYFIFAGVNRVLDCWPDHESYRKDPVTNEREAAPYKKTPGYSELDKLGEACGISYDFKITFFTLSMAEWLKVFDKLSGGKNRMVWHEAKPLFTDSNQLRKRMPPPIITIPGEITKIDGGNGKPIFILPQRDPSGPNKGIVLPLPGDAAGKDSKVPPQPPAAVPAQIPIQPNVQAMPDAKNKPAEPSRTIVRSIMPLERLNDNDTVPDGYARLDRDNMEQEKEGIKKKNVLDQKEWLDGISAITPTPYDGIVVGEFERLASYFELSPEAKKEYLDAKKHPKGLTLLELFEIHEKYAQKAGPGAQIKMNAEVSAYGILGIKESFTRKGLEERGIDIPLFQVPTAYEEKPKLDQ